MSPPSLDAPSRSPLGNRAVPAVFTQWFTPSWLIVAGGLSAIACGGAAPMLHPAHPLPAAEMSAGAGASTQVALGTVDAEIADGEAEDANGTPASIARRAFIAPGVAPWVAARLGLGQGNEAGITYTGRSLRVDGRHAFTFDELALSIGIGASSVHARRNDIETSQGGGVLGWGVDVPVLLGWQSRAEIISIWIGARAGYESLGNFSAPGPEDPAVPDMRPSTLADAYRGHAGGLLGFRAGIHPIWVSLEFAATQHWVHATERQESLTDGPETETGTEFQAFTLAPAGALLLRF